MTRSIPIALQESLDSGASTQTLLMKVTPVTQGYDPYGITFGNRDVTYLGLTYSAAIGFQPSSIMGSADLSVDNAEAESLMPEFDIPISEADIRAGVYDYATFIVYLVDYENLAGGHVILQEGTLGRISIDANGLSLVNELRGLSARLKQSVCTKDSLTCRAIFGSQPIGSATPGPQVLRDSCGFDATSLLVTSAVTSVGLETQLVFTVGAFSSLGEDDLRYGSVTFTSGLNAGRTYEIETNSVGGEITLVHEALFPIEIGDGVEYREGCNLRARDADHGCKRWFGSSWVLHFRGEPDIPIGDAGQMETPGASSGPGTGAPTYEVQELD
jgi:uncharacterized phage protein (TIGR02218 family)